jgi:VWFA-related protein
VEAVYVDAFVTRDGRPVTGLRAANFDLRDEGEPRPIELVAVEDLPLSAFLVFDTSGSVEGPRLSALRQAGEAFLAGLRDEDEVGLLSFSHELRLLQPLSPDRAALRGALRALRAEGGTALWDALHAALTLLPRDRRGLVVVFSDGEDNMSVLSERQLGTEVERSNALVHAVGVTAAPELPRTAARGFRPPAPIEPENVRALRQTAEATGGRLWTADSPARLTAAFAAIAAAMNTRYVLRFEPGPRARPGWHRLELDLKGAKGEVRARKGYYRREPAR